MENYRFGVLAGDILCATVLYNCIGGCNSKLFFSSCVRIPVKEPAILAAQETKEATYLKFAEKLYEEESGQIHQRDDASLVGIGWPLVDRSCT